MFHGTRTPNTEFCTIDTIDSIRSGYVTGEPFRVKTSLTSNTEFCTIDTIGSGCVTDRKGENHFESNVAHVMLYGTRTPTPNTEFCPIDTIDSTRSEYVTDRQNFASNIAHIIFHGTRTPNTGFCMIAAIDSIRSLYVTDRKGENHFESKHRSHHVSWHSHQTLNFARWTQLIRFAVRMSLIEPFRVKTSLTSCFMSHQH
jgi:hypothetical protein